MARVCQSGGCTVTLVQKSAVAALQASLQAAYTKQYGKVPDMFFTTPGPGAGVVDLHSAEERGAGRARRSGTFIYLSIGEGPCLGHEADGG
jgi:hypothetical protein